MSIFSRDIEDIRIRMNRFSRNHRPFLFGINFELTEGFFVENPLEQDEILFKANDVTNISYNQIRQISPQFEAFPLTYDQYRHKFDIVHKGLKYGDSFLTNLTIKTPINTNISLREILERSQAPYLLYIPDRFVCFSPERFVKVGDGYISSNPMKGTINADIAGAEDIILNDFKETAEHNTIVDLIRNDLSIYAQSVTVKKYRYIDRITTSNKNILQVSSQIEGCLPQSYHDILGDILFSMLPAGSVCGAPKPATVELITKAEGEARGFYTGVFGYYDGQCLDSAVLIRYIEKDKDQLYFRSGGGITAYSNSEAEYNEVLDKIYLPFK